MEAGASELRRARAMALLEAEEAAIRRTARRASLCADDAEDAFQRAVEILLTRAPEAGTGSLAGWMHVVTRREASAVRRQRSRLLAGGDPTAPGGEPASEHPGPHEQAEGHERVALAARQLRRLKPQERRALALQAAGCSYAEIQAITGWTYTKVNRCLAEGRADLRRLGGA